MSRRDSLILRRTVGTWFSTRWQRVAIWQFLGESWRVWVVLYEVLASLRSLIEYTHFFCTQRNTLGGMPQGDSSQLPIVDSLTFRRVAGWIDDFEFWRTRKGINSLVNSVTFSEE